MAVPVPLQQATRMPSSLSQVDHASGNVAFKQPPPGPIQKATGNVTVRIPPMSSSYVPTQVKFPAKYENTPQSTPNIYNQVHTGITSAVLPSNSSVSNVINKTANIASTQNMPQIVNMSKPNITQQNPQINQQSKSNLQIMQQQPFFSKEGQMARIRNVGETLRAVGPYAPLLASPALVATPMGIPAGVAAATSGAAAAGALTAFPSGRQWVGSIAPKQFKGLNVSDATNLAGKGYIQNTNQSYKASMMPFKESMMKDRMAFAEDIANKKVI
jgi:hypothetical protein